MQLRSTPQKVKDWLNNWLFVAYRPVGNTSCMVRTGTNLDSHLNMKIYWSVQNVLPCNMSHTDPSINFARVYKVKWAEQSFYMSHWIFPPHLDRMWLCIRTSYTAKRTSHFDKYPRICYKCRFIAGMYKYQATSILLFFVRCNICVFSSDELRLFQLIF